MISVEEALQIIHKCTETLKPKSVVIEKSYGRILDCDVYSKYDLPPFRASIKDGYAILASDGKGSRKVLSGIKAGDIVSNIIIYYYLLQISKFRYEFIGYCN